MCTVRTWTSSEHTRVAFLLPYNLLASALYEGSRLSERWSCLPYYCETCGHSCCRTVLLAAPIPFGSSRHASLLWQLSKLSVIPRGIPPPFFCIQFFFNVSRKIVLYCLTIYLLYTEQQLSFKHILAQECTNPGRWVLANFEVDFSYLKNLRPVVNPFLWVWNLSSGCKGREGVWEQHTEENIWT